LVAWLLPLLGLKVSLFFFFFFFFFFFTKGKLSVAHQADPSETSAQIIITNNDLMTPVRALLSESYIYFVLGSSASFDASPLCSPASFITVSTPPSTTVPVPAGTKGPMSTHAPDVPNGTTNSSGVGFEGVGNFSNSPSTTTVDKHISVELSTAALDDDDDHTQVAVYIVPAVAFVVLFASVAVICVAVRRKRSAASAVIFVLAILTGGMAQVSQMWSQRPRDSRAIVSSSDLAVDATLVLPLGWKANVYLVDVRQLGSFSYDLIEYSEPSLHYAGAVPSPGGTAVTVETPVDTGSDMVRATDNSAVADAMVAASPSIDVDTIIYSISGVFMVLSALFAIGVWVWMRKSPKEKIVRLETPLSAYPTAPPTPPLVSANSSVSSLAFKDALSMRSETEYSKVPSPRTNEIGYDAVPPQEYEPAPAASDVATTSSAKDSSGYTRPPARYDSVVDSASFGLSLPTADSSSSQYTRPGVERRAFASGEIDFASPDEEDPSAAAAAPPAMRTVDWSSIVLGERIGAGSYGEVFNATLDGEAVAVKKLLDESGTKEFERETSLMSVLPPHRNVLRVYAAAYDPPAIVSELCELGSLDQHQRLTQRKLLIVARDIADGVAHLHAHSIVHRDLAARNLLVNSKRVVKVADFGLARITNEDQYASTVDASAGPAKWMAPETIEKGKFSPAGDVWSFGVVLWELATGKRPFADMTAAAAAVAIAKGQRLPRPADISDEMWALMQSCWHTDPHKRPAMTQIVAQLAQMLTNVARKAQ
jgi:hypothetical protein